MPSLDDLRRIIRRIETRQPPRAAREPIERVVGGEVVDTGAGSLLVLRHEYSLDHRHGHIALDGLAQIPMDLLGRLTRLDGPAPDPTRLLFVDTETTGLAGGTGTYAFLVGAAGGGRSLRRHAVFMRDLDEEPRCWRRGRRCSSGRPASSPSTAAASISRSSRPIRARAASLAGAPSAPRLLRPARRVWTACYDDCRLATLERAVLGLARDGDVPGALIPSLYFDWLRLRRASPLTRVFTHNRDDVLSLAALLSWFVHALGDAPSLSCGSGPVGRLWEDVDLDRALVCYGRRSSAVSTVSTGHVVRLRLAWWRSVRPAGTRVRVVGDRCARAAFDPRPGKRLAKFHEHRGATS